MTIYFDNIEKETLENNHYRKVISTCPNNGVQLVVMSLLPNEEIGMEKHDNSDQFIRVEKGTGYAQLLDNTVKPIIYDLHDNSVIVVPLHSFKYIS